MRIGKRRRWIALTLALAFVVAIAVLLPRYVRARAIAEAQKRGYAVSIERVRFAWLAVRLVGVRAESPAVVADLDEVRVDLTARLDPTRIVLAGGRVELRDRERASSAARGAKLPVVGERLAVSWPSRHVEASGVSFTREESLVIAFADSVSVDDARANVDAGGVRAVLADGALQEIAVARARVVIKSSESRAAAGEAPSIASLRARVARAAAAIDERLPASGRVAVGALTVARGDLTIGPGAFLASRDGDRLRVAFTARGAAKTPLEIALDAPRDRGAVRIGLRGGPITLAELGVADGAHGLYDTTRASIEGRADATVDDRSVDFDVDLRATDLAVQNRRLDDDPVRGIALGVHARGNFDDEGHVAIDGAEWSVGALRVQTRGTVHASRARVVASLDFAVPEASCQSLLDTAPPALVAIAAGLRFDGTLAARARVAFDSDKPHALKLDYSVNDTCRVAAVPHHLDKSRFHAPFVHRFYAPDGSIHESETGPGTSGWTPLAAMSRFMPIAVVMTEDGGEFKRSGFNRAQIQYAFEIDLAERRFARGASTLTMQLAKNLFLSRKKTAARKIEEVILTEYMSQQFTKEEILELYLNVVEFGPNIYGVRAAAAHYFGKGPANLTLRESLFLAAMLPSPVKLHGLKGNLPDAYVQSIDRWIDMMKQARIVTEDEAEKAVAEAIVFR
jgi:hypothetical protein